MYGELAAASFLRGEGFSVLRRNWRPVRGGELDLVCRDGNCLVFVEVKTRTGNSYGGARRAVDARKRALIRRGAAEWLRQLPEPVPSRYDIVEVLYREGKPRNSGIYAERSGRRICPLHEKRRRRRAFRMTDTELRHMAPAAMTGESRMPQKG
ncbi:YraN family protein [Akkermansia sp. JRP_AM1]|uniref:YraN family protein n=1 Tax=Akkermansia sp. JRP_AM1 TaxID=3414159 RepID=UPI003BFA7423